MMLKEKAVQGGGKSVYLIRDNKIVGTGVTQTSIDDMVSVTFTSGDVHAVIGQHVPGEHIRYLYVRYDAVTGELVEVPRGCHVEVHDFLKDTRIVDSFKLRYGMVPAAFKAAEGYASRFFNCELDRIPLTRTPYFTDHLNAVQSRLIVVKMSQPQHTEMGGYVYCLYYNGILDRYIDQSYRSGYPHNGGEHSLTFKSTVRDLHNLVVHLRKDNRLPERHLSGKKEFLDLMERRISEKAW